MLLWSSLWDLSHIVPESLYSPEVSLFCHLSLSLCMSPVASFRASTPHSSRASPHISCPSGYRSISNVSEPGVPPTGCSLDAGWVVYTHLSSWPPPTHTTPTTPSPKYLMLTPEFLMPPPVFALTLHLNGCTETLISPSSRGLIHPL